MQLRALTSALIRFYVHCSFQLMIFVHISMIKFIESSFQNSSSLFAREKQFFIGISKNIIIIFSCHPQHEKGGQDVFFFIKGW